VLSHDKGRAGKVIMHVQKATNRPHAVQILHENSAELDDPQGATWLRSPECSTLDTLRPLKPVTEDGL